MTRPVIIQGLEDCTSLGAQAAEYPFARMWVLSLTPQQVEKAVREQAMPPAQDEPEQEKDHQRGKEIEEPEHKDSPSGEDEVMQDDSSDSNESRQEEGQQQGKEIKESEHKYNQSDEDELMQDDSEEDIEIGRSDSLHEPSRAQSSSSLRSGARLVQSPFLSPSKDTQFRSLTDLDSLSGSRTYISNTLVAC